MNDIDIHITEKNIFFFPFGINGKFTFNFNELNTHIKIRSDKFALSQMVDMFINVVIHSAHKSLEVIRCGLHCIQLLVEIHNLLSIEWTYKLVRFTAYFLLSLLNLFISKKNLVFCSTIDVFISSMKPTLLAPKKKIKIISNRSEKR